MTINEQHVALVEKTIKEVIDAEILECTKFLGEGLAESLKDFVTGFRGGLVMATKRQLIGKTNLFGMYGDLREKEGKEYAKKRIRTRQVRELKGKIHAVASVISLVDEAASQAATIVENQDAAKNSLLQYIVKEAKLYSNG